MKTVGIFLCLFLSIPFLSAQDENTLVRETVQKYIDGTAEGKPELISEAFHEDLNLYSIKDNNLKVLSGKTYISWYEDRKKRNRVGRIVSVDVTNDIALAEVEIKMPSYNKVYTDYLMLLKIEGTWKIVHKSYTLKE